MQLLDRFGPIFGPGSEWFWSFAQVLIVVVSLFGIYRQLRSQAATNAVQRIEVLQGRWSSLQMTYAKLEFALAVKAADGPISFQAYLPILDYFAELAGLELEGYIGLDEIGGNFGLPLQIWTVIGGPALEALRAENDRPELYGEVDALVEKVRAWYRREGRRPVTVDADSIRRSLDFLIASNTALLEREYAIRQGVVPRPPTAEANA